MFCFVHSDVICVIMAHVSICCLKPASSSARDRTNRQKQQTEPRTEQQRELEEIKRLLF